MVAIMKKFVLIDGHSILHRAGVDWGCHFLDSAGLEGNVGKMRQINYTFGRLETIIWLVKPFIHSSL